MGRRCADAIEALQYLQRRITEERKEGPRQKYVKDLQLIHDRKKNQVLVPLFLPRHDQEAWFAKLDSNGIWKFVFEFLTDPSDVTSAYFACETFRKHLEEKRKMMMMPKVLKVLHDSDRLKYWGFKDQRHSGLPVSKKKKMESREVLKLRLVSKSWKKSVEDQFLVPVDISRIQGLCHWEEWDWHDDPLSNVCRFREVEDEETAIRELENTNSCAPLIRMMLVDAKCDDQDKESFYSKLAQFLDLRGEAVWALCFSQRKLQTSDFNYEELCNIVTKLPNLKVLRVESLWDDFFGETDENKRKFMNAHQRLRSLIAQKPFPALPSLESLTFDALPVQYECLIGEILTKTPNVEGVVFSEWDLFKGANGIPNFIWNALGNLHLKTFKFMLWGNMCLQDFLRLGQFDWPLELLHVHFDCMEADVEFDASSVFETLGKFNETLVDFKLCSNGIRFVNDHKSVVVDFPKLKEIDIGDFPTIEN